MGRIAPTRSSDSPSRLLSPQAGCIGVEALGFGNWIDAAQLPVSGEPITYFGAAVPIQDIATLSAITFISLAFTESTRGAESDAMKVNCIVVQRRDAARRSHSPPIFTVVCRREPLSLCRSFPRSPQRIYPGGAFDPMGLSKDAKGFEERKIKEVKNGR